MNSLHIKRGGGGGLGKKEMAGVFEMELITQCTLCENLLQYFNKDNITITKRIQLLIISKLGRKIYRYLLFFFKDIFKLLVKYIITKL